MLVLGGALLVAAVLWLFSKIVKLAIWIVIIAVLVAGVVTAVRMAMGT